MFFKRVKNYLWLLHQLAETFWLSFLSSSTIYYLKSLLTTPGGRKINPLRTKNLVKL